MGRGRGGGDVVAAVLRGRRLVMLSSGRMLPITVFLDGEGKETDDPEEAVEAIAGEGGLWVRVTLAAFEVRQAH